MRGLKLKQIPGGPDSDGDVRGYYRAVNRLVTYTIKGNGLYPTILHEFGHYLNGDHGYTGSTEDQQNKELKAWLTASLYCLPEFLEDFIDMANRCLATFNAPYVTAEDITIYRSKHGVD